MHPSVVFVISSVATLAICQILYGAAKTGISEENANNRTTSSVCMWNQTCDFSAVTTQNWMIITGSVQVSSALAMLAFRFKASVYLTIYLVACTLFTFIWFVAGMVMSYQRRHEHIHPAFVSFIVLDSIAWVIMTSIIPYHGRPMWDADYVMIV